MTQSQPTKPQPAPTSPAAQHNAASRDDRIPEDRINDLLQPFQQFGVNLGLERMARLLAALGNPQEKVPFVHVAGSNGKGSVCAYVTSVLSQAGYRVGRYTSPHLVSWRERICMSQGGALTEISWDALEAVLQQAIAAIDPNAPTPTLFEIVTAAAWLYFAQQQVDIAVIEVGLGGRLDATNCCDRPLVSVITSISKEHWQVLGETLAEIAGEKAGILKPERPAVVGPLPPEAAAVVQAKAAALRCPSTWVEPARLLSTSSIVSTTHPRAIADGIEFELPLAGPIQLTNAAIAIATVQSLRQQGWQISTEAIAQGMAQTQWTGRMEWRSWQGHRILTDGAHNPAAAVALRDYVDSLEAVRAGQPVTWVMGMLSTKEHGPVLRALLRGGDRLYTAPVPGHSTANPQALIDLARTIVPDISDAQATENLFAALQLAVQPSDRPSIRDPLIVFCGSLYLLGYFLQQLNPLEITP